MHPHEETMRSLGSDFQTELNTLLAPYSHERTFEPGALLWKEGDRDGMMVTLLSGHVKIYSLLPEGGVVTYYIFGPGEIFGFMPLLDDEPYPVHARAVDNVSAKVVTREALHEAVTRDPGLALFLIKLLSKRLREAFLQTERLSIRGVVNKVAMALNSLMPEAAQERAPTILTLSVSSRDFAGLYGLSPESFSRGITTLVQEEVILRLGHNSFQVLDVARLQQYALPHLL